MGNVSATAAATNRGPWAVGNRHFHSWKIHSHLLLLPDRLAKPWLATSLSLYFLLLGGGVNSYDLVNYQKPVHSPTYVRHHCQIRTDTFPELLMIRFSVCLDDTWALN